MVVRINTEVVWGMTLCCFVNGSWLHPQGRTSVLNMEATIFSITSVTTSCHNPTELCMILSTIKTANLIFLIPAKELLSLVFNIQAWQVAGSTHSSLPLDISFPPPA